MKIWEYIIGSPQSVVKGYVRLGILRALDELGSDDYYDVDSHMTSYSSSNKLSNTIKF